LKHASNVPRTALAIEEIFRQAGFVEGAFQALMIGSAKVAKVLEDDRVRAATLTGSEGAGRAVGAKAGDQIKPTVLELGGSDPFLVMPSADLERAVSTAVTARTINNGQSCIAAKRFIVHEDIYDEFAKRFVAGFEALEVGDPMKRSTDIGPLATAQIRDEVDEYVRASIERGARRLTGAEPIDGPGSFYRPGILAEIPEDSPAYGEEIFGPVAMLFKARDLDDAIRIGNATRFGLASAIWTADEGEIERAIDGLDAGATFVNSMVASDPRLPFGGVKKSGYGRELARDGIREFVNRKTISVA
jgi:succinate-semialdehyde dehydrogenase/glutarate-semialdehyde dehydrogenase